MKVLLIPALVVATLALSVRAALQEDSQGPMTAEEPLPEGAAATIDDEIITFDAYKEYLLRIYGAGPLEDLILTRLFERRAKTLDIQVSEEELDRNLEAFWEKYLVRFRGDQQALERELGAAGFTPESYRMKVREESRRNLLESRIIAETREIPDELLRMRFDQLYGKRGVKVEVRHILFTGARIKANLRQRGVRDHELDDARIESEMNAKVAAVQARLDAGEDFVTVAKTESHDISVHQNDGLIPGYNYERYGDPMAEAVRAAKVGVRVGPVRSAAGMHLVEVTSRTTTKLEDVAEDLTSRLLAEPASWQERNELRRELRREARVRTYR